MFYGTTDKVQRLYCDGRRTERSALRKSEEESYSDKNEKDQNR